MQTYKHDDGQERAMLIREFVGTIRTKAHIDFIGQSSPSMYHREIITRFNKYKTQPTHRKVRHHLHQGNFGAE
jgi:hypothetical protein